MNVGDGLVKESEGLLLPRSLTFMLRTHLSELERGPSVGSTFCVKKQNDRDSAVQTENKTSPLALKCGFLSEHGTD